MWEREIKVARKAADEAGKILKALFGRVENINKKGEIDIVTEADIQSEEAVIDIIRNEFPQDSILS
ncbi:MAG: inositol monophosphatase, partial [Deltaproteobacteria bacterium]|nr:inositol monophosphatase [Deltaproteobacteria bacterium]